MARKSTSLVDKALLDTRESRQIDFKRKLDVNSTAAWCEIVKDIAAMANSGGGAIVIGLDDFGQPSGWDPTPLLEQDPALLVDRLAKFTGEQFDDVDVLERRKGRKRVAVLLVGARTGSPLIFEKEGTYRLLDGKDKCAFAKGSVYFRHGAKSEPGLARDLQRFAKLEESSFKRELMGNISKVSKAPRGSEVLVLNQEKDSRLRATGLRIVDHASALAVGVIDLDQTHPLLLNQLLRDLNTRIDGVLTPYDLLCVRKVYKIADKSEFFHKPLHGSPQYSPSYIEWLVKQYQLHRPSAIEGFQTRGTGQMWNRERPRKSCPTVEPNLATSVELTKGEVQCPTRRALPDNEKLLPVVCAARGPNSSSPHPRVESTRFRAGVAELRDMRESPSPPRSREDDCRRSRSSPRLSIVVLVRCSPDLTRRCLARPPANASLPTRPAYVRVIR